MARELQPDLLLSCISLKSLSGLELTTAVKRELPRIKVFIGSVQGDREQGAPSAGADALIANPMSSNEFQRKVDLLLLRSAPR
jgi:DNA-binding NarL/FixJ family response regulator